MITKIKANDLIQIACAAHLYFHRAQYEELEEIALQLKNALCKTTWDDDAELTIDEMPF